MTSVFKNSDLPVPSDHCSTRHKNYFNVCPIFPFYWKLKTLKSKCTYLKVILIIFFILEYKDIAWSCWQKEHTNEKRGKEQKEIVFAHSMAQFCKFVFVFFNELVNNTKGKNWWPPVWTLVYIFLNCKRASYKARNTTYLSYPHSQNLANSMFQQGFLVAMTSQD